MLAVGTDLFLIRTSPFPPGGVSCRWWEEKGKASDLGRVCAGRAFRTTGQELGSRTSPALSRSQADKTTLEGFPGLAPREFLCAAPLVTDKQQIKKDEVENPQSGGKWAGLGTLGKP